jgi:hypothetical protein
VASAFAQAGHPLVDACDLGPTSETELARILPWTSAIAASFIALLSALSRQFPLQDLAAGVMVNNPKKWPRQRPFKRRLRTVRPQFSGAILPFLTVL